MSQFLHLSGIPASGKSFFGRWLASKHKYIHVDVEQPGRLHALGLEIVWNECFSRNDASSLAKALKGLGAHVVLDWGFPTRWLHMVEQLKDCGFSVWWFDADHEQARSEFIHRGAVSLDAFEKQMADICRNWVYIKKVFASNIITTLDTAGTRPLPEVIYEEIRKSVA